MLRLDHGLILVSDLDSAATTYRRLGFTLTPRGRHPSLGTANHTIMFERDYLELITIETRRPANDRWAAILDRGDGLGAMALGTDDARAVGAALRIRGVAIPEIIDFERPVTIDGGRLAARFSVAHLPPEASPALPAFFCQHHTRDLVWLPQYQRHSNGARGIAGLVVADHDPERLAAGYQRLLGRAAIHPHPGGVELDLRGARLLLVHPKFASRRLGHRVEASVGIPRPLGVTVAVVDLDRTRSALASARVPYAPFGRRSILVGPAHSHGLHLEFVAA
jgi:hypothetical protein